VATINKVAESGYEGVVFGRPRADGVGEREPLTEGRVSAD
jgi:hypothetical protein